MDEHCLLCPSFFFTLETRLVKSEPCKLAFNGTRRNDPASSRCLTSFFLLFHSFLFEKRPRGRNTSCCYRSFSRSTNEKRARTVARREFVTRENRSISRFQWKRNKGQRQEIDREIAIKKKKEQTNVERDLIIEQACTLTNFRERIVKGAKKPESMERRGRQRGKKGGVKEMAQE